jgi:hypothetical protein
MTEYEKRRQQIVAQRIKEDDRWLEAVLLESSAIRDHLLELVRTKNNGHILIQAEWIRDIAERRIQLVAAAVLDEPAEFKEIAA